MEVRRETKKTNYFWTSWTSSLFCHWDICQFVFREILIPVVMGTTGNDWFLITSQISSRTTNFVEPNDTTTLNDGKNLVWMERKENAKWSNNKKKSTILKGFSNFLQVLLNYFGFLFSLLLVHCTCRTQDYCFNALAYWLVTCQI